MKNEISDRIMSDQIWTGTVKSVVRKNQSQSALTEFLDRDASTTVPVITLTVERSDGKTIVKQYRLKKDYEYYAEALTAYYNIGETVHYYKGKKYPKKENNIVQINNIAHRLCIACGNFDDLKHTECQHCKSKFAD